MNALEARRAIRRKAGLPAERSKSEEMAEWLEREWDALESASPEDKLRGPWRDREDAWLANLRKYEARHGKERA